MFIEVTELKDTYTGIKETKNDINPSNVIRMADVIDSYIEDARTCIFFKDNYINVKETRAEIKAKIKDQKYKYQERHFNKERALREKYK